MSLELLQSIEKAEEKAEEIRAQAQREARDMLKSVEEANLACERSAVQENKALVQGLLAEAALAAQKRIDAQAAQEETARLAVVETARQRLDAAATLIYERIVSHGDR